MTEQQIEQLEKMFPHGYVILLAEANGNVIMQCCLAQEHSEIMKSKMLAHVDMISDPEIKMVTSSFLIEALLDRKPYMDEIIEKVWKEHKEDS